MSVGKYCKCICWKGSKREALMLIKSRKEGFATMKTYETLKVTPPGQRKGRQPKEINQEIKQSTTKFSLKKCINVEYIFTNS